jgi:copper chaperone CopZ
MKTVKLISAVLLVFLAVALYGNNAMASEKAKEATVKIKTSAICDMCKATIEKAVKKLPGIKSSVLDVKSKILTVSYETEKTTPGMIRKAVSAAGYNADNVAADKAAFSKLAPCCQKEEGK